MATETATTAGTKVFSLSLSVVWAALFVDYLLLTFAVPIFPVVCKETGHASEVEVGVLFSMKAVVQVISSVAISRIVDKAGLKLLVVGLIAECAATVAFIFTQEYFAWLLARAAQGLASGMIIASGFSHLQKVYAHDDRQRGVAMSYATTGIVTGVICGPPIGGVLFEVQQKLPFIVASLLTAFTAAAAAVLAVRHGRSADKGSAPTNPALVATVIGLMRDKHILATLGALMLANACIATLEATFGLFLSQEFGYSAQTAGLLYIVTSAPTIFCSGIAGRLGNRYGRWRVLLVGLLIQGGFFMLGPKTNMALLITGWIGIGMGMGFVDGCAPAVLARASDLFHGGTGVVYTLSTVATQLGFILGPLIGTALMQAFGFWAMSAILGGVLCLFAPVMKVNSLLDSNLSHSSLEEPAEGPSNTSSPLDEVELNRSSALSETSEDKVGP